MSFGSYARFLHIGVKKRGIESAAVVDVWIEANPS